MQRLMRRSRNTAGTEISKNNEEDQNIQKVYRDKGISTSFVISSVNTGIIFHWVSPTSEIESAFHHLVILSYIPLLLLPWSTHYPSSLFAKHNQRCVSVHVYTCVWYHTQFWKIRSHYIYYILTYFLLLNIY